MPADSPVGHQDEALNYTSRELIDQKISEHEASIQRLQAEIKELMTKRNELAPISVLPPELLARVFIWTRNDVYPRRSWLRVTHVCRHWRETALSFPDLWSDIDLADLDFSSLLLDRAKMAPLALQTIMYQVAAAAVEKHFEIISSHLHHTHSLNIECGTDKALELLRELLSQTLPSIPAPLLTVFRLNVWFSDVFISNDNASTITLPRNVFENAPHLRSLDLNSVRIEWEHCFLQCIALSRLGLCNVYPIPTLSQIVSVLKCLPQLRTLELVGTIPPRTSIGIVHEEQLVRLTLLEKLRISGNLLDCSSFLRHLFYPSRVQLQLECASESDETNRALDLFSNALKNQLDRQCTKNPIHSVHFVWHYTRLKVNIFDGPEDQNLMNGNEDHSVEPRITFELYGGLHDRFGEGQHFYQQALLDFCSVFDLSNLSTLALKAFRSPHSPLAVVQDYCASLPNIRTITVSYYQVERFRDFCNKLGQSVSPRSGDHLPPQATFNNPWGSVLCFPSLKTLVIEGVEFGYTRYPESMNSLVRALEVRYGSEAPLEQLEFLRCQRLKARRVQMLENLVTGVILVDGAPLGEDEESFMEIDDDDEGEDTDAETEYSTEDRVGY